MVASGGELVSFVECFPKMRSDFVQGVEPVRTKRKILVAYGDRYRKIRKMNF